MIKRWRLPHVILALLIHLACGAGAADAQTCNFSITSLNFGNIDVTQNTAATTSGTYTATCSGLLTATRTCPNVDAGTGGSSSGSPRYMLSGANQLAFNLFSDASYATIWGSYLWGFPYTAPPTDISTILLGNGSTQRTMYARIPSGQQTVPPGTYTTSFAGNTKITYAAYLLGLFPPDCATMTTPFGTATFTVTATVVPSCTVAASNIDFGSAGLLTTAINAATTLQVTCSATTPYTISLDGGLSGATDPTARKMTRSSQSVTYGLYQDAARSLPWGNTIGSNTVAATGTGLSQPFWVYGRVAQQTTPGPGTYTDTIVVTVTY